uniref:Uncharacterized protein n=1 Tax=Rhizophora mucronata TaxID=61149 RepID=A0A2P2R4Y1_RHIMU
MSKFRMLCSDLLHNTTPIGNVGLLTYFCISLFELTEKMVIYMFGS